MKFFGDLLRFLVKVFPLVVELVENEKERKRERKERERKEKEENTPPSPDTGRTD